MSPCDVVPECLVFFGVGVELLDDFVEGVQLGLRVVVGCQVGLDYIQVVRTKSGISIWGRLSRR